MHLSRNCPFSNKTNLHLELPDKNDVFLGKCHDNKFLKVQILLSSYLVVMAQAPTLRRDLQEGARMPAQRGV